MEFRLGIDQETAKKLSQLGGLVIIPCTHSEYGRLHKDIEKGIYLRCGEDEVSNEKNPFLNIVAVGYVEILGKEFCLSQINNGLKATFKVDSTKELFFPLDNVDAFLFEPGKLPEFFLPPFNTSSTQ